MNELTKFTNPTKADIKKEYRDILKGGVTIKVLKKLVLLLPVRYVKCGSRSLLKQPEAQGVGSEPVMNFVYNSYEAPVNHYRRLRRAFKRYGEAEVLRYLVKYS